VMESPGHGDPGVDAFDQAVTQSHMTLAGWEQGTHRAGNPFVSHYIYIVDYRTKSPTMSLYGMLCEQFHELSIDASKSQLVDAVTALADLANEHDTVAVDEHAALLFGYFKSTRTYALWLAKAGARDRFHAVINMYPNGVGACVRPFVAFPDGAVMSLQKLVRDSATVSKLDRQNHPEWFQPQ